VVDGRADAAPRRRDAQENRRRILMAAREVFSEDGFDAPLDAIARRAGVGRATLYRNFADRYALGSAIFEHNLEVLEALARAERGRPGAFRALLSELIEQQVACHALVPALLTGPSAPDLQALALRVTKLLRAPLKRAQDDGEIRVDLTATDVLGVLAMLSAVMIGAVTAEERRARTGRALELLFGGLLARPTGPAGRAAPSALD
jgi:AcrR family transcriptional regulator